MLGICKDTNNTKILEDCGKKCIERNGGLDGILVLKDKVKDLTTRTEYCNFFKSILNVDAIEVSDGIELHLHKKGCTCSISKEINKNKEILCYCTKGHEKIVWSTLFDKDIDIEVVKSINRGDDDCVVKIINLN